MSVVPAPVEDPRADAALTAAAALGDRAAFEALYRRHADAAWRVASAVAANPHDAADAVSDAFARVLTALEAGRLLDGNRFRSYLLSATRNAAVDLHRRSDRSRTTDRLDELESVATARTATDAVDARQDARLVALAFRGLPERWRSVLWLTEVEGIPPREAATLLGLSANNVSQLALRARAGLRERYVQAHLRAPVDDACRFCVERLGGYVLSTLSPRDLAKVDQHLAGCAGCRQRAAELDDLRTSLRRIVVPLPLLLAPALAKWQTMAHAAPVGPALPATPSSSVAGAGSSRTAALAARAQRPLLAASTGLFALGVIGASVVGGPGIRGSGRSGDRPPVAAAPAPGPQVIETRPATLASTSSALDPTGGLADDLALAATAASDALAEVPGPEPARDASSDPATGGGDAPGPSAAPPPAPAPAPPAPSPLVALTAGAVVAGRPLALSAGSGTGTCTGVAAGSTGAGCAPAAPAPTAATAGLVVTTDGTIAGGALAGRTVAVGV